MTTATRNQNTPKVAPLHQHQDGTIHALGSDGRTTYIVQLGAESSCTCRGWVFNGKCYHMDSARARFGAFVPAPWATKRAAASVDLLYAEAAA